MGYLWAIFVVTALTDGSGDYRYVRIEPQVTYENRVDCEEANTRFVQQYQPFQDNESVWCLKVDE